LGKNLIRKEGLVEFKFKEKVVPRIKELIEISLRAVLIMGGVVGIYLKFQVSKKLNKEDRKFCFEIFGYDFLIDCGFNVWLIEVNTNPCIETSSRLLEAYIPRMLGIFVSFFMWFSVY